MLNKKIGLDVDDCICNTLEMDFAYAYYKYKGKIKNIDEIEPNHYDVTRLFNIEDGEAFYKEEKTFLLKNVDMYPKVFVKEVLKKLKEKGFEIYIISARKAMFWDGDSKTPLKKWLEKFEIPYDEVFVEIDNKNEVCKNLNIGIMIEDNPGHVQKINNEGIETILIRSEYNKNYSHSLNKFAQSWIEVYKILGEKYGFDYTDLISE